MAEKKAETKGGRKSQVRLGLDTLGMLQQGVLATAFQKDLEFLVRDCVDRPGDKRPRTLSLKMTIEPNPGDEGICDQVNAEFSITAGVPNRRSRTFNLAVSGNGAVMVNPDNPGSANQGMLGDMIEAEED